MTIETVDKYTDKQVCDILDANHFSNLLQYVLHMFGTMPRSMSEEDIIQYLKMNKNIGIAFKFMPEEVKEWCRKYSKKLYWYDMDILADCWTNGGFEKRLYNNQVYALLEDYKYVNPEQIEEIDKIKFLRKDINMTEQEIVDYLKKNKSEGKIIAFMPDEVKRWCEEHRKELLVWQSHRWHKFDTDDICTADAVTLYDDYKIKEGPEGEWGEYDIKDGQFYEETRGLFYTWHEWSKCMSDNPRFTAFGGWQYANSNTWFMTPKLKIIQANLISYKDNDTIGSNCYTTPAKLECEPAVPVKIRFWREVK